MISRKKCILTRTAPTLLRSVFPAIVAVNENFRHEVRRTPSIVYGLGRNWRENGRADSALEPFAVKYPCPP
jgi:hypothetical protein